MLSDYCVGDSLALDVVLNYRSCKLDKILSELGHRGFVAFSVVDQVCCRFVNVMEVRLEKTMDLNSVGVAFSGVRQEKREWQWRNINQIDRWYLDLVVKHLHCINRLNA